jgi:hypothetical protein
MTPDAAPGWPPASLNILFLKGHGFVRNREQMLPPKLIANATFKMSFGWVEFHPSD